MNALLICKYFSILKGAERKSLNETDKSIKKKYKLLKRSTLTTKKIMNGVKDFNKGVFKVNGVKDFEVIFVDHIENKYNLQKYSYPKDIEYKISQDELDIITAIR